MRAHRDTRFFVPNDSPGGVLEELRRRIDRIDRDILDRVAERRETVAQAFEWKAAQGSSLVDRERELRIRFERRAWGLDLGIPVDEVDRIVDLLLQSSHRRAASTLASAARRPQRLRPGDRVAIVSPSWGGPSKFPVVYERGLRALRERFGLEPVEMPHVRADADWIASHPQARADDLHAAFEDDTIHGIIASIGGDDCVRVLPHLDATRLSMHPKVLLGYSDTATLTTWCHQLGFVTFNGPSVMAGFAQLDALPPEAESHIREVLFSPRERTELRPFPWWTDGYPDWIDSANSGSVRAHQSHRGEWSWLQGHGVHKGRLFGGCIEVLEFVKATPYWPHAAFWDDRVLFFETSEEAPEITAVVRMLRNYGSQGVFDRITAVLFGRARSYPDGDKRDLEHAIGSVISGEFGQAALPIVCDLDFGHTDPQWILPLGVTIEIDCDRRALALIEPAVE